MLSGADIERIKEGLSENDPVAKIEAIIKEQEAKEKVQRRHDVILRAVQNINPEIQSGRLTNGWNWWGSLGGARNNPDKSGNEFVSLLYLSNNYITRSNSLNERMGAAFVSGSYERFYLVMSKENYSSTEMKICYQFNNKLSPTQKKITDLGGKPLMLFADKEVTFFAVNVDGNKVRLYEREESDFVFSAQMDFTGETITSMEGGENIIFITTQSKKVFAIKRNNKGSYTKLTHTQLGIDIEGNLICSKCTPDGKIVVFVNSSGYNIKGKEFVRIYEHNGSKYQKLPLDMTHRNYEESLSYYLSSKRYKKNLQISNDGNTILLIDTEGNYRYMTFTVIRRKGEGYYVVFSSKKLGKYWLNVQDDYGNSRLLLLNYTLSDCGRYLFISQMENVSNEAHIVLYYFDLWQDCLLYSHRLLGSINMGRINLSTLSSNMSHILDMDLVNGHMLRLTFGNSQDKINARIFIEIPWEV